jgi:hypothetical protein
MNMARHGVGNVVSVLIKIIIVWELTLISRSVTGCDRSWRIILKIYFLKITPRLSAWSGSGINCNHSLLRVNQPRTTYMNDYSWWLKKRGLIKIWNRNFKLFFYNFYQIMPHPLKNFRWNFFIRQKNTIFGVKVIFLSFLRQRVLN